MFIPTKKVLKRILRLNIAGTRGGPIRLGILLLLEKNKFNINEIAKRMSLDYKTVQHHVRVLEKSNLVTSSRKSYGNAYTLSTLMKTNKDLLKDISEDMRKTK